MLLHFVSFHLQPSQAREPTNHFAGWRTNLVPFPFLFIYFKIYLTWDLFDSLNLWIVSFNTSEKSIIILFRYGLCYILFFSHSILHDSLSFFYVFHLFIFPGCSLDISSDLHSNLLILSLANTSCYQMHPLGVCIHCSVTQSVVFREAALVSPGSLLDMAVLGPDFKPTKSESMRVGSRKLFWHAT